MLIRARTTCGVSAPINTDEWRDATVLIFLADVADIIRGGGAVTIEFIKDHHMDWAHAESMWNFANGDSDHREGHDGIWLLHELTGLLKAASPLGQEIARRQAAIAAVLKPDSVSAVSVGLAEVARVQRFIEAAAGLEPARTTPQRKRGGACSSD
jgi:hypothetical protein